MRAIVTLSLTMGLPFAQRLNIAHSVDILTMYIDGCILLQQFWKNIFESAHNLDQVFTTLLQSRWHIFMYMAEHSTRNLT